MNAQQLALCTGARIDRAAEWLPSIVDAMAEFQIDNKARQAAFLAQIGHETGGLHWTVEIWGPTDAQKRYEGRKDLGNVNPGDGVRYKGRGIFQLTGRANYARIGKLLNLPLIAHPELAEGPETALRIACEYWKSRGLNAYADKDDVNGITKRINGGFNGLADRKAKLAIAKRVWKDGEQ